MAAKTKPMISQTNDIAKLVEFFGQCKDENPQFFYDYLLDKEDKIRTILWSYACQQGQYADFGDVFTFGTTHHTNAYNKPLAIFVGGSNAIRRMFCLHSHFLVTRPPRHLSGFSLPSKDAYVGLSRG